MRNASAIVFHIRNLSPADLPPRKASQLNVFFLQESPHHSGDEYKRVPRDFFNLTMTHRKDSDVFYPYDSFQPENGTDEKLKEGETWTEHEVGDSSVSSSVGDDVLLSFGEGS